MWRVLAYTPSARARLTGASLNFSHGKNYSKTANPENLKLFQALAAKVMYTHRFITSLRTCGRGHVCLEVQAFPTGSYFHM